MITDTYSKMMPDVSRRSVHANEDLSKLIRERKQQDVQAAADLEKELKLYRSGSAPPTVEGSLSSIGGLFNVSSFSGINNGGFISEEEFRADPAYVNYYYNNVNLNPRLPPPLQSKEDWRFSQRFHVGGIGDRRKVGIDEEGRGGGGATGNGSLFSVEPGFGCGHEEIAGGGVDWGGGGLIGLPALGLGSRQKSIAEIIQGDLNSDAFVSRQLPRPTSQNAFNDSGRTSNNQFAHLHRDLTSIDALHSGANNQDMDVGAHTYASALGGSLSRNATPEPQLAAGAPGPRIPTAGGGRAGIGKRNVNSTNSLNNMSASLSESVELVGALSGLNLSTNGMTSFENSSRETKNEMGGHDNVFNLRGNRNHLVRNAYLDQSESGHFNLHSASDSAKGKSTGAGMNPNNSPPLNGGIGSPSQLQNLNKLNSPFPNYGLSGFGMNPSSPPMMGNQLGNGSLQPLFGNLAAPSSMSGTGLDSRARGGGLGLGPNLIAAAAELQNLNRHGNQMPLVDPFYLQFIRANEFATNQLAALSDPTMDREYANNAYIDLLQKAYLGTLLSQQKSQYGAPYLGNPAFGLAMSYPGSPLAGSFSGSPVGHGERRFYSGMRNPSGGVMGAWHSEAGGSLDEGFASTLLDEFKSNKTKSLELLEIAGHIVEFSADQYGSRFIQQKLETASTDEKNMVFRGIMPQALSLMTDVFGNYVVQKFFEHGTAPQIKELADQLTGHVLTLSLQMYGCRVIQKAIEVVELDQQTRMVKELDGHIMRCVRDQNGNHVIQKCIECIPEDVIQFIVSIFYDHIVALSTHPYGCRVIQRVLEHCHDPKTQRIMMDEILLSVCMLAQDQYGNYVVQHVLEYGKPHERTAIINKLSGQIVQMSLQKFASNVIEKCLTFGTVQQRQTLVTEMLGATDENEPLQIMMKDQFANYVVQKVLETCDDQQLELILNRIKVHLNALKKYTYGKHIVARVEKLVAAGERRISILSLNPGAV